MLYETLRTRVCNANIKLGETGLVILTWGNVSEISPDRKVMAIKPSGVDYGELTPELIVLVDTSNGKVLEEEGKSALNPSSDTPTHIEMYRRFPEISGITHTHSPYAVAWAQADSAIPALGTTHADAWYGPVPVTRPLTKNEVSEAYELNTGKVIVTHMQEHNLDPVAVPGILVSRHGPFTWAKDGLKSVEKAVILEEIAKMAAYSGMIAANRTESMEPAPQYLLDKHYLRKHGPDAYYGQKN